MNRKAKYPAISAPEAETSRQACPVLLFDIGNVFLHIHVAPNQDYQTAENTQLTNILSNLKNNGYKIIAVTDASTNQVNEEISEYSFYQQFDDIIISEQCGLSKTNPKLYEHILNTHNLSPVECIFIDDKIENLEAAQKVKIYTIHFTTPKSLLNEFTNLNIRQRP